MENEQGEAIRFKEEVPGDVLAFIEAEVEKDVAPIAEEDPATAEFLREVMDDYRKSSYSFFRWIKAEFNPDKVLYPASGFDQMPKIALGEERVVHTSLEEYEPGEEKERYFEILGKGKKVIADNVVLPFPESTFQAVFLLDSAFMLVREQRDEFIRVLEEGGIIILTKDVLVDDTENDRIQHYGQSPFLESLTVADQFQKQGEAGAEFFIFRKIGSTPSRVG